MLNWKNIEYEEKRKPRRKSLGYPSEEEHIRTVARERRVLKSGISRYDWYGGLLCRESLLTTSARAKSNTSGEMDRKPGTWKYNHNNIDHRIQIGYLLLFSSVIGEFKARLARALG